MTESNTTNTEKDSEMEEEAEERKLHRMAKVHDISHIGRAAETYVLLGTNFGVKTSR